MNINYKFRNQGGFSLIEMAIVLVILGLLLGGLIMPLSSQHEIQKRAAAQNLLEDIRTALIGFAQVNNGRLPCPASAVSNGQPLPNISAACTVAAGNILVPYAVLGIRGNVVNGQLVDEWLQPIQYYLTSAYSTSPILLSGAPAGTFTVCAAPAPAVCAPANLIASNVVAVLFSSGDPLSGSPNPIALPPNANFYSDTPQATFDDIVVWIPQPELIYALSKTK